MKALAFFTASILCIGAANAAPHWTYEGAEGPTHWGEIATEYATCGKGTNQSPIDLNAINAVGSLKLTASYKPVPLTVLNNGHTVQFNTENAGSLIESGVEYKLIQVHFHAPSEHVYGSKHEPLEAHFVHVALDGTLAVLGVFIVEGKENPALKALMTHLPETEVAPMTYSDVKINPSDLLPKNMAMYRYMGSLTTPPCTEGVNWHVLKATVTASKDQIKRLEGVLHDNARPAQATKGRLIVGPTN